MKNNKKKLDHYSKNCMIFLANSIKQIKNVGILYKIKSKLQIKHKVN